MRIAFLVLLFALSTLHAQSGEAWKKLDFLLGDWKGAAGEKDTSLGAGQGAFSFKAELQQKIIVRRNNAQYDSGVRHDDLMMIYLDTPDQAPRAIYFVTEGHVIHYTLSFPSASRVVFESDSTQPGPKYRLTYWMDAGSLKGRFEIAPPSKDYQTYLSWSSTRK